MLVLAIATLVYLIDRQGLANFLPSTPGYRFRLSVFGALGDFLPSLAHTFSFIIISAVIFPLTRRNIFRLCWFWSLLEALCELLQHPTVSLCLQTSVGTPDEIGWLLGRLGAGTFDRWDILAIMLGAYCAYRLLLLHAKTEVSP